MADNQVEVSDVQKEDDEDSDNIFHNVYSGINALLEDHADQIFKETVDMVEQGMYTPDIMRTLYTKYHLSGQLLLYFNNEAISLVRMKSLSADEVQAVAIAYNQAVIQGLKSGQIS